MVRKQKYLITKGCCAHKWRHQQWVRLTRLLLGVVAPTRRGGMRHRKRALTRDPPAPAPIAGSPCWAQPSQLPQRAMCLPGRLLATACPFPYLMAPVEEGERCHICDLPAWGLTKRICWCKSCALALLPVRNITAVMIWPKCAVAAHAHLHANRWLRLAYRNDCGRRHAWNGRSPRQVSSGR